MRIFITLITFTIHGFAFAGLVEPCAKWERFPVKVCRGTDLLKHQYFSKLGPQPIKKKEKHMEIHDKFRHKYLTQSNVFYPDITALWDLARDELSKDFTKETTGIFFEFIETQDISQCDSVLFFAQDSQLNISSIGDRTDSRGPRKIITDKNQKVPSITIVSGNDPYLEEGDPSDLAKNKKAFESIFRASLFHEIGHLAGLRHTHAYERLSIWKEKRGASAVDVCGMDRGSIMDYEAVLQANFASSVLDKLIEQEDHGPARFATPGTCLNNHDKKILRCLYDAGTKEDNCPEIKCKFKKK